MKNWDVLVIGGGAAGLMAGISAGRLGKQVLVCEGMPRPGRKIALTGGGRCNFCNTLSPREFVRECGDSNGGKLGTALRSFSSDDLIGLLAAHGVGYQVEKDIRLYTKSGKAEDVVKALVAELVTAGATLEGEHLVTKLAPAPSGHGYLVRIRDGRSFTGDRVIVCTGGMSFPGTGSTGDGYDWARDLGHKVTDLRPALVGFKVREDWPRKLQGLACNDAQVTLLPPPEKGNKKLAKARAEFLFTHFGVSGPPVLDLSTAFVAADLSRARLVVDFLPAYSRNDLDRHLQDRCSRNPRRSVERALEGLLPGRLLTSLVGADGAVMAGEFTRSARTALLTRLQATELTITGTRGIKHGEVTAGGVRWADIDPNTLESRISPGLYFAGEILDFAGRCGGFNLQAAFSTGYLAGLSAATGAVRG